METTKDSTDQPFTAVSTGRSAVLTKVFAFEAAHFLPGHTGQCVRLHGHTYRLELSVCGPIQETPGSELGMIMDFSALSTLCHQTFLDDLAPFIRAKLPADSLYERGGLDHNVLNWILPMRPTAEHLAHWIWDVLIEAGLPDPLIYRVRVWETQNSLVEVTRAERVSQSREEENYGDCT